MNERLLALLVILSGALAAALIARRKGYSFAFFLLAGLSCWPAALVVALLARRKKQTDDKLFAQTLATSAPNNDL